MLYGLFKHIATKSGKKYFTFEYITKIDLLVNLTLQNLN